MPVSRLVRFVLLLASLPLAAACASSDANQGAGAGAAGTSGTSGAGPSCGYLGRGQRLEVSSSVAVCLPPVTCTPSESCPRGLADCIAGVCVPKPGYAGLATLPEAWATYYCDLASGACDGSVLKPRPLELANALAAKFGPLCDASNAAVPCVGVAAVPPLMAGNSQIARDPSTGEYVPAWGLGMSGASGVCYRITGQSGTAVVGISDRCGGYCKCGTGAYSECSACLNQPDTTTECPCVGSAPPLYSSSCASGAVQCDWCASNNHPHFDLDNATFAHVCGEAGLHDGRCRLTRVEPLEDCYPANPSWPN